MKELIQGFGEMKGKTLIKISFKAHQDFFFKILFRLAAILKFHLDSKSAASLLPLWALHTKPLRHHTSHQPQKTETQGESTSDSN